MIYYNFTNKNAILEEIIRELWIRTYLFPLNANTSSSYFNLFGENGYIPSEMPFRTGTEHRIRHFFTGPGADEDTSSIRLRTQLMREISAENSIKDIIKMIGYVFYVTPEDNTTTTYLNRDFYNYLNLPYFSMNSSSTAKWTREAFYNYMGFYSPLDTCSSFTVANRLLEFICSLRYGNLPYGNVIYNSGNRYLNLSNRILRNAIVGHGGWNYIFSHCPAKFTGSGSVTKTCNTILKSSDIGYSKVLEFYNKKFTFVPDTIYRTGFFNEGERLFNIEAVTPLDFGPIIQRLRWNSNLIKGIF